MYSPKIWSVKTERPQKFQNRGLSLTKWEMELEEIEAILEKIWDLHDKLSDAIHSISRTYFLNSVKALRKPEKIKHPSYNCKNNHNDTIEDNVRASGFIFVKDLRVDDGDNSAVQEAKNLNAIRTALENLEDQLKFFHVSRLFRFCESLLDECQEKFVCENHWIAAFDIWALRGFLQTFKNNLIT